MPVIELQEVHKRYRLGRAEVHALRGVSLRVARGEFLAIVGPSGSGKTTLLNLMGCLDRPSSGRVLFEGVDVTSLSRRQLAELRSRRIGFVFQTFNLIPVLTALENVEYPLWRRGMRADERRARAMEALRSVGLAGLERHRPEELSGGQRQRVAIARALVGQPAVVLADEPTANLDRRTGQEVLELMRELNRSRGTTFVFSTHDPKIMAMADRVVELSDGRIAC